MSPARRRLPEGGREVQPHRGPAALGAHQRHVAPVGLGDAAHERQAQPGAVGLAGEELAEGLLDPPGVHALPGVLHLDPHQLALAA